MIKIWRIVIIEIVITMNNNKSNNGINDNDDEKKKNNENKVIITKCEKDFIYIYKAFSELNLLFMWKPVSK